MKDDKCGNCRFWVLLPDDPGWGQCRINPPAIVARAPRYTESGGIFDGSWPAVLDTAWCGSHARGVDGLD